MKERSRSVGVQSKRDKIIESGLGRKIVVHLRNRGGPKVEGKLVEIDWAFKQLIVEGVPQSAPKILMVQMKDIVRWEISQVD